MVICWRKEEEIDRLTRECANLESEIQSEKQFDQKVEIWNC